MSSSCDVLSHMAPTCSQSPQSVHLDMLIVCILFILIVGASVF